MKKQKILLSFLFFDGNKQSSTNIYIEYMILFSCNYILGGYKYEIQLQENVNNYTNDNSNNIILKFR